MIYLLIGSIALLSFSVYFCMREDKKDLRDQSIAFYTLTFFTGGIGLSGLAITMALGYDWVAAEHQARIINREYGTDYTRQEVFYASKVIDTVRELDRKRIQLNGDLMRDE